MKLEIRVYALLIIVAFMIGITSQMIVISQDNENRAWEIGSVYGNLFNDGDSSVVNSFNKGDWDFSDDVYVTDQGIGVSSEVMCFDLGTVRAEATGFITVPLEPGEMYNVRVLARNEKSGAQEGPMRPREGDDHETNKNKLSFQYESESENNEGYIGDRYNMYITGTDWSWYEMSFTTPNDLKPNWSGDAALVFAMRASTCWIQEIIVENANTLENIFNGGNSILAEAELNGIWSGTGSIYKSREGEIIPTEALYIKQGINGTYSIPLQENSSIEAWILARSESISDKNTISFGQTDSDISPNELIINNTEWEWKKIHFKTHEQSDETNIIIASEGSDIWVEGIVVIDISSTERSVTIQIDESITHQTIEGFGFFGAMDVWWSGPNPETYYNEQWLDKMLIDLGTTMWRNEVYPYIDPTSNNPEDALLPEDGSEKQDSNWQVQKHVVKAINDRATELGVPLRIILTAWSPPPQWKQPKSAKGGKLLPEFYEEYGHWWVKVLNMYEQIGVSVYGISLQNEPYFEQTFNSTVILADEYVELIKKAVPIIKEAYPNVLIFGAESMLRLEHTARTTGEAEYHKTIMQDPEASRLIDRFAVHGYSDGVNAEGIENHKRLWELERDLTGATPIWMTETSGYGHHWADAEDGTPGALNLAAAISSALLYGDISAWVFWQGHVSGIGNTYNLWYSEESGNPDSTKKFSVSKQFYKFIRPNAVRIDTQVMDTQSEADLLVTAYRNEGQDKVITIINTTQFDHNGKFEGLSIDGYEMHITTGEAGVDCISKGKVKGNNIKIPAYSVITLAEDIETKNVFEDMQGFEWAQDAVSRLLDDGIISGTSAYTFSPTEGMKQSDFVALLERVVEIDGMFIKSEDELTRQEMFKLAYSALGEEDVIDYKDWGEFADYDELDAYDKAVLSKLITVGLVLGDNGQIYPHNKATRAEIAVFICRLRDYMKEDFSRLLTNQ